MKYLYWLLAFIPITIAARYGFHLSDGIVFWLCCVGIVPLPPYWEMQRNKLVAAYVVLGGAFLVFAYRVSIRFS
jgi:hypothetical protein